MYKRQERDGAAGEEELPDLGGDAPDEAEIAAARRESFKEHASRLAGLAACAAAASFAFSSSSLTHRDVNVRVRVRETDSRGPSTSTARPSVGRREIRCDRATERRARARDAARARATRVAGAPRRARP